MTDQADQARTAARAHKFDTSRPNVARIYDYLLGGKDHFAADRQAAQRLIAALPNAAAVARANRTFLAAAVQHVAREGIAQFLDIGAGLRRPRACTSARGRSSPVRGWRTWIMTRSP